jgi:hypothetical protein
VLSPFVLGLELVKQFQVQTQSLVDYTHLIALESESTFTQVHTQLCKIDLEIQTSLGRVDKIESTLVFVSNSPALFSLCPL